MEIIKSICHSETLLLGYPDIGLLKLYFLPGFVRFLEVSSVIILWAFKTDRKISFVKERK